MDRRVHIISPNASVADAAARLRKTSIKVLPVGEHDRMIGTISDLDIAAHELKSGQRVRDIMSCRVIWAYENDLLEEATRLMFENGLRHLPIVNAFKRLAGIVSAGDLGPRGLTPL